MRKKPKERFSLHHHIKPANFQMNEDRHALVLQVKVERFKMTISVSEMSFYFCSTTFTLFCKRFVKSPKHSVVIEEFLRH